MKSALAYEFKGLANQSAVNAFCIDQENSYVAQTVNQDTIITKCDLNEPQSVASTTAETITLQKIVNVHSLSLIQTTPKLILVVCGQPIDANGQVEAPELWHLTFSTDSLSGQPAIFKITHLESANITGTPLPQPVIGAVSALSSDHTELAVMVLDRAQHLQGTVYNVQQISKLIWQLVEQGESTIPAGDLRMMAAVFQSFKPTAKQLDPATIGSIQSIAFSNGRAIYATKSHGQEHAIGKGFWLLKNGFHDQTIDDLPVDTQLTGIALFGDDVYFCQSQTKPDGTSVNTIQRVEKSRWNQQ